MRNVLAAAIVLALGMPAFSQTTVNSVRVYTDPEWREFMLDGQKFLNRGEFLWPVGTKHIVTSYDQYGPNFDAYYTYQGWLTNLSPTASPSHEQPLTASPELKWVKLAFKTDFALTFNFGPCMDSKPGGKIEILGAPPAASPTAVFDSNGQIFLEAFRQYTLRAYPYPGCVFRGWGAGSGFLTNAFEISFTLNGPRRFTPIFMPATATQVDATIQTVPAGLEVIADRTAYTAPIQLEWQWGTTHTVGATEFQMYKGLGYVFESWSDGGSRSHDIVIPSGSTRVDLTARFVRGASAIFRTSPQGLKLTIDGDRTLPAYDFTWLPGSTHTISAPATQMDASGRKYEFDSWTGGKPATFAYTAPEGGSSDVMEAKYNPVGQVTITSDPSGLSLRVDGKNCVSPCAVERPVGASVEVAAPDAIELGEGGRLRFIGWRDASSATRRVTASADPVTYTAQFKKQFRLSLGCNPAGGASFQSVPSSADGYYDADTLVSVSATVKLGFRVLSWTGDLSGPARSGAVLLDSPKSAVLQLEPVPELAAQSVWNSAAEAPSRSVSPGSLISIYGAHLAPELITGSANPLPQTLGGVTVRVNDTFLPLLFVSPEQINAQLVSPLEPGPHKLVVRVEGKPEISVDFDVARNAPGLFTRTVNGIPVGLFIHPNGEPVSPESPARPGETLTLFGTGFGPYQTTPPDGFPVSESPSYSLIDDTHVLVNGVIVDPLYAGRTNVGAGVDAIRFVLPAGPSESRLIGIKVTVNGFESNTVSLPLSADRASIVDVVK